jgi:hypothetical protein
MTSERFTWLISCPTNSAAARHAQAPLLGVPERNAQAATTPRARVSQPSPYAIPDFDRSKITSVLITRSESSAETSGLGASHVRAARAAVVEEAERKTAAAQRDASLAVKSPLSAQGRSTPVQPSKTVSSRDRVIETPPSPKVGAAHTCVVARVAGGLWVVRCRTCRWKSQPIPKHAVERTMKLHEASGDQPRS